MNMNSKQAPVFVRGFPVTSLYVPSGLHTGTKTCGKSFLACCSVYFFSATHLDVSEEDHKSPESLNIRETHDSARSSTIFLLLHNCKTNILLKSEEDVKSPR